MKLKTSKIIFFFITISVFSVFSLSFDKFIEEYKKINTEKLTLPGAYSMGSKEPTLKIIEIYDYLCPYCSEVSANLKTFAEENQNTVQLVFINFPLDKSCNSMVKTDIHSGACELSYAAYCASEQNRFLDFHEQLFSLQMYFNVVTKEKIIKLAKSLKLNITEFDNCLISAKAKNFIKTQIEFAKKNNVNHTPTVFINNRRVKTIPDQNILTSLLQHESF